MNLSRRPLARLASFVPLMDLILDLISKVRIGVFVSGGHWISLRGESFGKNVGHELFYRGRCDEVAMTSVQCGCSYHGHPPWPH